MTKKKHFEPNSKKLRLHEKNVSGFDPHSSGTLNHRQHPDFGDEGETSVSNLLVSIIVILLVASVISFAVLP